MNGYLDSVSFAEEITQHFNLLDSSNACGNASILPDVPSNQQTEGGERIGLDETAPVSVITEIND